MNKAAHPIKIALVDDDNMFLEMTRMIVSHDIDENVVSFQSSKAAWDHMQDHDSANIILSDINMPEMDGLQLLTQIKQRYPAKICIMMSGDPDNEQPVKKLGADGFLNKPFQARELLSMIQSFLSS
jgi:DNA-binding NtrC family response regulator